MTIRHPLIIIFLFAIFPILVNAQQSQIDSLRYNFQIAQDEEKRYVAANNIYSYYEERNRDSALHYIELSLTIAQNNHHKIAEGFSLVAKSYQLMGLGRFADALQCLLESFAIAEDKQNENEETWDLLTSPIGDKRLLLLGYTHQIYGFLMFKTENTEEEIFHYKEAARIGKMVNYPLSVMLANMNLGRSYLAINEPDSGLYFEREAERIAFQSGNLKFLGALDWMMGDIYQSRQNQSMALQYYYSGLANSKKYNNLTSLGMAYFRLSKYHIAQGNPDSALYYARNSLLNLRSLGLFAGTENHLGNVYKYLYQSYNLKGQFDSAFKYLSLALVANDSILKVRIKNLSDFRNLSLKEQLRLQNVDKEKIAFQNKIRTWFLLAGIGFLLVLAIVFFRNDRQKQKAKTQIEKAYDELKSTQAQLIQSEKMASLGEITAGIAHEIQNPLNFINNFAQVNEEFIEEAEDAINKGQPEEAMSILNNLKDNQRKINQHGQRADLIVKGMLQHSRSSAGQKEPTDMNALVDEYLRLSYHGWRAKDNTINIILNKAFDPSVNSIKVVPQDIGRVILNLCNNAFYAVGEKKKTQPGEYEPTVEVSTAQADHKVEIRIKDNGNGIPESAIKKIFQPFYTTKPSGQGTGLGLSLSYDIIKAHGGEIRVESEEGKGTEFIVELPA
jgi:signal transduction histidine kinase